MTIAIYILAAVLEIAGCFAFWSVVRLGAHALWLIAGVASLTGFGWLLAQTDSAFAGRAFAAYGGVYIAASVVWLALVEAKLPDRWDLLGAAVCLVGAAVIVFGPRS
jgi:small multidrug resistance family-3 protein